MRAGNYTIRNIPGGTYTLKATLQGFKEFVQTGIPVTAGSIVRINGRLEIGALSESVTVMTETAILKTDKADVSVDLKPEDVVNLPLNQYRNYQYLMNLVPGATPPEFQNAQTDTPGRALRANINGTNRQQQRDADRRRRQHQRVAAAPCRIYRAGRDDRERQHLDQQLRRRAGHDRRRRDVRTDQVRHEHAEGLGVLSSASRTSSTPGAGISIPSKLDSSASICGGTLGGPIRRNKLFSSGRGNGTTNARGASAPTRCRPRRCVPAISAKCSRSIPNSESTIPRPAVATARIAPCFDDAIIPADRISGISQKIQTVYPAPNNAGTNNGLQNNVFLPRQPKADPRQLRREGQLEPYSRSIRSGPSSR